jgi:hypothetical protein
VHSTFAPLPQLTVRLNLSERMQHRIADAGRQASQLFFIPTTVRRSYSHGWMVCSYQKKKELLNEGLPDCIGMMDEDEKYFKAHGEPLFSSHMIDLSEEEVDWNIQTTAKYLKRAAPMKQWLEMVGE